MLKKSIMCLAALAVVALGATSCKKDVNNEENGMQFRAIMETGSAKTELSGTNVNWIAGDEVMIYGTEQSGVYTATPDAENATAATLTKVGQPAQGTPYTAIYPASAAVNATTVTLPAVQQSVDGNLANTFPMFAQSESATLNFKNLCGVLKIHLEQEGATVSRISVTANTEINGNFSVDNSGEAPAISYVTDGDFTTTLICSEPQDITNGKDFYIYMPAGEYSGLKIMIMNAGYGVEKNAPANATITIERSKYSTLSFANVNMPEPPEGGIWGLYSISATEQVWISSGNLQYSASSETWRFAPEQYVYNSTGWKDLFGWGTSGWDNGNTYYLPTDRARGESSSTGYGYGPTNGSSYRLPLTGDYANSDWGVYNAISNGGNQAGLWRTLTSTQMNYLVGQAGKRAGGKYGIGTVHRTRGVIILPDYWVLPEGLSFVPGANGDWSSNTYDDDEWKEMEAAGAIFLPAAGYYWGETDSRNTASSMSSTATCMGYYWTATNSGTASANYYNVSNSNNGGCNNRVRYYSYSVRLVKDYVPANE